MVTFDINAEIIVEIYKYISPVIIWIEIMKQTFTYDKFQQSEFFKLLKEMRNEVSHFDISQNDRTEFLFIKIVIIYKRLGLNLIDKSRNVQRIWNGLHNNSYKRNSIRKLKDELNNIPIVSNKNFENHLNLFKSILFSILNPNNRNQYYINLINIIFQYISPIIIWHKKMINTNETNSKLFKLVDEIKNRVCHLSENNYKNCTYLKEILKSILVCYKIFGIDLNSFDTNFNDIDFRPISLCIEYKEHEIREEIIENLKNQKDMKRNHYETFKELINQLVVKVVPHVYFNMGSVLDVKEERITAVKDKMVQDHTIIEINNENEGLKTSNKNVNEVECSAWESVLIILIICGIIFGVYKLYKFLRT